MTVTFAAALVLALALALAPPAGAAARGPWATVNVCDTAGHPDGIGIRGSMPGGGPGVRLFMRFVVQYRGPGGRWRPVGAGGDSGWVGAGSAGVRGTRQAGQTFTVTAARHRAVRTCCAASCASSGAAGRPSSGARGPSRAAGHPGSAGADPANYSAATCVVR